MFPTARDLIENIPESDYDLELIIEIEGQTTTVKDIRRENSTNSNKPDRLIVECY